MKLFSNTLVNTTDRIQVTGRRHQPSPRRSGTGKRKHVASMNHGKHRR